MYQAKYLNFSCVALGCLAALLALVALQAGASTTGDLESGDLLSPQQPDPRKLELFSFVHFKSVFNKHYGSIVEELSRQKLFVARLAKAAASQVNYLLKRTPYYLGINQLSDWTPEERRKLRFHDEHPMNLTSDVSDDDDDKDLILIDVDTESDAPTLEHERHKRSYGYDRVYHDLRQSGCFTTPRTQYNCGSCYAFSFISIIEYYFCKSRGELIEFSEQLIVDCSQNWGNGGCNGGWFDNMVKFTNEIGVEQRIFYKYVGYEQSCPYGDLEPRTYSPFKAGAGYFKVGKKPLEMKNLDMRKWSKALDQGYPIYVALYPDNDFDDFGGGVYPGCQVCDEQNGHTMVVVGDGQLDGQDYWLLRNSYGDQWAEDGYIKISKDAMSLFSPLGSSNAIGTILSNGMSSKLFRKNDSWNWAFLRGRSSY